MNFSYVKIIKYLVNKFYNRCNFLEIILKDIQFPYSGKIAERKVEHKVIRITHNFDIISNLYFS